MPWIRTPEVPHDPRHCRALRFRLPLREIGSATSSTFDFGANHSIHLHSGLQFPCLRFAVSVATPHARLGTRLLARLCHGSHLRLLDLVRFQGATLIEPDVQIYRIRLSRRSLRPSRSSRLLGCRGVGRGRASRRDTRWGIGGTRCLASLAAGLAIAEAGVGCISGSPGMRG